ncbi:hypothetical protein JQS43_21440 [Natronosporangium hydrolyticum]|uniref:Uncharacterized protein n=2 Tax=Natronosporangium hydrolyticum TaxID=2811111 RepID=A0A895YIW6_9ACTN|nr:DUF6758 family protein [Natronosporangium hydrolyticum]QSB14070.1 hypothetical protein JQS43_21440 [Natronosporangium hydrolyticum]
MSSDWRCEECGPVPPLHVPDHINDQVLSGAVTEITREKPPPPLWCPWPLPPGWTVTGVGWAGDDRAGARATVLAASGPAPLLDGPADLLLVAEAPGVGLASRYAGLTERDPGPLLAEAMAGSPPHAKVRTERHPTPLWSVPAPADRSAYVGEANGIWLVAVAWPASAGYLLADDLALADLVDWLPPELVYGAPCARLLG